MMFRLSLDPVSPRTKTFSGVRGYLGMSLDSSSTSKVSYYELLPTLPLTLFRQNVQLPYHTSAIIIAVHDSRRDSR